MIIQLEQGGRELFVAFCWDHARHEPRPFILATKYWTSAQASHGQGLLQSIDLWLRLMGSGTLAERGV